MIEASTTRPLRSLYMYSPMNSAIGTVHAIVNVPQELPGTAWVTPAGRVISRAPDSASGMDVVSFVPAGCGRATVKGSLRTTSALFVYTMRVLAGSVA